MADEAGHEDSKFMEEALALAAKAAGRTSPNPLVGAVVVAEGRIVGRGFHRKAGEPHAEAIALREAGHRSRGATVYVSLEPCAHVGRTGRCTDALIAAGVSRVVAAMTDPDPRVDGRGVALLREAGIAVEVGLLEDRARRQNTFYIKHRRTGLPFVTLKWAMSLDGKIAVRRGVRTEITGPEARRFTHGLRGLHDAVLVGVGTVLADDPLLTCRLPDGRNPLRVVLDSNLSTPPGARVLSGAPGTPTLVVATRGAPEHRGEALRQAGAEVLVQDGAGPGVDLRGLMEHLGARGVLSVLIEGGGTVHAAAIAAGIADRVIAVVSPSLIGGVEAPTPVDGPGIVDPEGRLRLVEVKVTQIGEDTTIEGMVAT